MDGTMVIKFIKAIIITLAIISFLGVGIILLFISIGEDEPSTVEVEVTEEEIIEEKLDLKAFDIEKSGDEITGKIKNTTGKTIDYLEINFDFIDKEGVIVEEDMTNKTDFKAGTVWQFKIFVIEEYDKYNYTISEGF